MKPDRWYLPLCATYALLLQIGTVYGQDDRPAHDRFAPVHELLADHVEREQIAGAVGLVMERGRVVYRDTVGWCDVADREPMTQDTIFRMASMTKPVTSVAVMMLVDEGRLSLDDPLLKFVPEFAHPMVVSIGAPADEQGVPAEREITIHDLLTHTSGITYGFFSQQPHSQRYRSAGVTDGLIETPLTLAESIQRLATCPLTNQPGAGWQYGLSTDVLGRVVEVVSGQTLDEFFQERIFGPLDMDDTYFFLPDNDSGRLATLYRPGGDNRIEAVDNGPQQIGPLAISEIYRQDDSHKYLSGGAGLVSTADDYARFLRMLLGKGELDGVRLLKPETVELMTGNRIGDLTILFPVHGDRFGYGFGVHSEDSDRNGASIGTWSWGGVFHTYFWVDPKREVIGIVLTQLFPFDHLSLWADYQQRVYDALDVSIETSATEGPQPGEVYREYATHNGGNRNWRVTDPDAASPGAWQFLPNPELTVTVDSLEHAVRAEAVLDRWGGHPKTTAKSIRFNGNDWLIVPELTTTPEGRAEYYYSQDNPVIEVPLEHLRAGVNTFDGTCSALDGFRWGQWGLYSLILRVYYDPDQAPHPRGRIASPEPGAALGDAPEIALDCSDDVVRADLLAWYDGNDEDGDGLFRDWHGSRHQPERGAPADLHGHVGTDTEAPFQFEWDTTWVPDQSPGSVTLVARVCNDDGVWCVTEPVDDLTLTRDSGRVALYPTVDLPEDFGVRIGQTKRCTITIPGDAPLDRAREAVLSLRTWHGWDGHHEPIRLNGRPFTIEGKNHHYDFDLLPVPASLLQPGENVFEIESRTEHHMLEVLWPGPALIVRYETASDSEQAVRRQRYEQHALTHAGDPDRGRVLFLDEQRTKCGVCHRVDGAGGQVGPDLTSIGGKFDRPHLIESLLEPSRQIVEGYRTTAVVTTDGRVLNGIVREQDEARFTLLDAENKPHIVRRVDVESSSNSDVSIMPVGLAEALAVDEFTDLIAYLESLRPGGNPKFGAGITGPILVPGGFDVRVVATGISGATAMETLPDGRLLICEQPGAVRVVEDGVLLDEPFVTLPVESFWERGVIGVTIDPDFPQQPYVYVCWVVGEPYPHHHVSRFTADGNAAVPGSELLLLVGDDQRQMGGKVPAGHQGGALHFGPDGKLYIGIGEQTAGTPSQELDMFLGKILRINPDGSIPEDNPFLDQTEGKYGAIWARGLRNPFTFAFDPDDGTLLINDVGGKFEEINVGRAGGNYGWPVVEHGPREGDEFIGPIHWYPQSSIGGGDFVRPEYGWPAEFGGRYLFADFVQGWIKTLDPRQPESATTFATGLRRPVDLRFAADGSLYVLLRNAWVIDDRFEGGTGSLLWIQYASHSD